MTRDYKNVITLSMYLCMAFWVCAEEVVSQQNMEQQTVAGSSTSGARPVTENDVPEQLKKLDNVGKQLFKQGNYSEGIEKYQQIIRDYPSTSHAMDAQLEIAAVQIRLKDAVGADAAVQQLLNGYADQPGIAHCVCIISWEYINANQPNKVKHLCQQGLSRWPGHSEAFNLRRNLAIAHVLSGEDDQAETATSQILSDYSDNAGLPKSLRMIADAYQKMERHDKAADLLLQVMRTWPKHKEDALTVKRLKDLTNFYIQQGNYKQADAIMAELISNPAGSDRVGSCAREIAKAYVMQREHERARQLFQQVLANVSDHSEANFMRGDLARIALMAGDIKKGLEDCKKSDKVLDGMIHDYIKKSNFNAIYEIGEEYYLWGQEASVNNQQEQARADYTRAIEIWQKNIDQTDNSDYRCLASFYSGIVCQRLEQYEQAVVHFQCIISKWPDYEQTWRARYMSADCIDSLAKSGKMDTAQAEAIKQTLYREILQRNPDCPVASMISQQLNSVNQ